jgi:hypothetical protein
MYTIIFSIFYFPTEFGNSKQLPNSVIKKLQIILDNGISAKDDKNYRIGVMYDKCELTRKRCYYNILDILEDDLSKYYDSLEDFF